MVNEEQGRSTQDRILDGAEALFRRFSYAGFRMNLLADRLKVSRKTLYNHFSGGKRHLWRRCVERRVETWAQGFRELAVEQDSGYLERSIAMMALAEQATKNLYGPGGLITSDEGWDFYMPEFKERLVIQLRDFFQEGVRLGILKVSLPLRTLSEVLVTLALEWGRIGTAGGKDEVCNLPEFIERVLLLGVMSEDRRNLEGFHQTRSHFPEPDFTHLHQKVSAL